MRLSEYKNEDAIELLADLIEPIATIFADEELKAAVSKKAKKVDAVKIALKNNSKAVIEILARLDGKSVEEYECTPVSVLMNVLELLNDKELVDFFMSQAPRMDEKHSGAAMATTKVKGK